LRARPALGVSVGEQQSHYYDAEQNKTDRAHGSSPSPSFSSDAVRPIFGLGHYRPIIQARPSLNQNKAIVLLSAM
jgi:hypothetical protein